MPVPLATRSAAARLTRLRVWLAPGAWMSVCCECCVLSGRSLCDELITRPEESYRLWRVVVCDLETSWMRRSWPTEGSCAKKKVRDNRLCLNIIWCNSDASSINRSDLLMVYPCDCTCWLSTFEQTLPYLLTPWSRALLEKRTGSQLVKKFPAFCGTQRFITAFTSPRHLSLS